MWNTCAANSAITTLSWIVTACGKSRPDLGSQARPTYKKSIDLALLTVFGIYIHSLRRVVGPVRFRRVWKIRIEDIASLKSKSPNFGDDESIIFVSSPMHDLKRNKRTQNNVKPKSKKGSRDPLPARSSWDDRVMAPRPPPKATIARGPDGKFRPREMVETPWVAERLSRLVSQSPYQAAIERLPDFTPPPSTNDPYPYDVKEPQYTPPASPTHSLPLPDITTGAEGVLSPISEASPIEEEEDLRSLSPVSEPPRYRSDKNLARVAVSAWYPGKPAQILDSPEGSPDSISTTFSERIRRTKPLPDVPRDVDPEDGGDEKDVAD